MREIPARKRMEYDVDGSKRLVVISIFMKVLMINP